MHIAPLSDGAKRISVERMFDLKTGAPSLRLGSGNGLLQTPVPIFGFQPYVTAGVGIYRERTGLITENGFSQNVGGGVKMAVASRRGCGS